MALYLQNYNVYKQDILPPLYYLIPIFTDEGYSPLSIPLPSKISYHLRTFKNVPLLTAI